MIDFASFLNNGFAGAIKPTVDAGINGLGQMGNLTAGLDFTKNLIPKTDFIKDIGNVGTSVANNASKNKNLWGTFTDWLGKDLGNGRTNLNNVIDIGGLGANIWSGYNQQKMADKNFELQKDAYNFNKYLANEELRRRANRENNLKEVWGK
ncbi:hypothetical protein [Campylobacter sp. CCS1377]|uniref:Uncharacterized protein n=1 Tax=Campylobacter sp. CCS1377 TaxID=3158229 RepID=A0AAU7E642_9BACT